MKNLIHRFATPLTAGLFAVSGISGIALFLHWAPGIFHEMHEWLSMLLLLPFGLHLWKNWPAFMGYAKRGALLLPLLACLLVAVPFASGGFMGDNDGNPAFKTIQLMTQARLTALAPVLKTTPDALLAQLKARGYKVASADDTLQSIATASGVRAADLLFATMPQK